MFLTWDAGILHALLEAGVLRESGGEPTGLRLPRSSHIADFIMLLHLSGRLPILDLSGNTLPS